MDSSFLQHYQIQSKAIISLIHSWGALTVYTRFSNHRIHAYYEYGILHNTIHAPAIFFWNKHDLMINKCFDLFVFFFLGKLVCVI